MLLLAPLRWLAKNLSTLLLAFILGVVVWVSAVLEIDPNVQSVYSLPVDIQAKSLNPGLLIIKKIPTQVRLTINAPRSIWDQLNSNPDYVSAWVDLSGLGAGEHTMKIKPQISIHPAQVVKTVPEQVDLILEPLSSTTFSVDPLVIGDPSLGYRRGDIQVDPKEVTVSGPESLVKQVKQVRAPIDISDAVETVKKTITVQPLDENGNLVTGITTSPQQVVVTQTVNLLGGYRNLVVKVVTTGQVAEGYWLTNLSVTPPNVTVFSANPNLVNSLPPFVETEPIDLTGLSDDSDIRSPLLLPKGVSLVGEQSVLVRVGIAALEGSITMTVVPEVTGLPPELAAQVSPESVEVILAGPLPILRNLNSASLRLAVDLSGLGPGAYQVTPIIDLLPSRVTVQSILPESVQVTVGSAPTPTVTPSGVVTIVPTPRLTVAPAITPTPSRTPTPPTSAP